MVVELINQISKHLQSQQQMNAHEIINQVIVDPQVMWRKYFYTNLNALSRDQKQVLKEWFVQMTQAQAMYIGEIEKANNYLKMVVCQAYTEIGLGNSPQMEEFIKQINFIENRVYFQKRRREMKINSSVLNDT